MDLLIIGQNVDNRVVILVIYAAKMPQIVFLQLLNCEHWLLFIVLYHCKQNIFRFLTVGWTKQEMWGSCSE